MLRSLVGSEMCIRDSYNTQSTSWETVGVDVSTQAVRPDVVVTLEQVSFLSLIHI